MLCAAFMDRIIVVARTLSGLPKTHKTARLLVVVAALSCVASAAAVVAERSASSIRLTRNVPRFVTHVCKSARARSPLPLVCPPLVPVTSSRSVPGVSGVLLGNTSIPPVKPPADRIYLVGFNAGDGGPTYWHWIAGMGTLQAIRYCVLSDAHNEVK